MERGGGKHKKVKTEVKVLKEGAREDTVWDGMKVSKACCSAVVLVRAGKHNIIVDPGAMGYGQEVLACLREEGIFPDDIDVVVNTHMHLDHIYNDYLFPQAVIYTPTSVWHSEDGNRVEMFPHITDPKIPGVHFIETPGHMEKHISVVVESDGVKTIIAGDAVRESIIEGGKVPDKYPNAVEYMRSMKRIFDIADEIIPGHGPTIRGKRLRELKEKLARFKD